MMLPFKTSQSRYIIVLMILVVFCIIRSKCNQFKSTEKAAQYQHLDSTTECPHCNKTNTIQYTLDKNDNSTTEVPNRFNISNIKPKCTNCDQSKDQKPLSYIQGINESTTETSDYIDTIGNATKKCVLCNKTNADDTYPLHKHYRSKILKKKQYAFDINHITSPVSYTHLTLPTKA